MVQLRRCIRHAFVVGALHAALLQEPKNKVDKATSRISRGIGV